MSPSGACAVPVGRSEFLKSGWLDLFGSPWIFSTAMLVFLTALRAYAILGSGQARLLLPLPFIVMALLPWAACTPSGRRRIGLRREAGLLRATCWSMAAGSVVSILGYLIGAAIYGDSPGNWYVSVRNSYHLERLGDLSLWARFAIITAPSLVFSPVGEEIFFRAILDHSFRERWNSRIALACNAGAFGLTHLLHHGIVRNEPGYGVQFPSAAAWVLLMIAASCVFTSCRNLTGSLWPAVAAHASFNFTMNLTIFWFLV